MSTVQPNYLFLNNPAGADVLLANRILTLGQSPNSISLNVQKVKSLIKKEGAAAVSKTVTVTIPASPANSLNYAFQLTQQNESGEYVSYYVSYETTGSATQAELYNGILDVVTALVGSGAISATITGTASSSIVVTGSSSNPIVIGQAIQGFTAAQVVTAATGAEAFGQGDDLIAAGVVGVSAQPVSGTSYDALFIEYGVEVEPGSAINRDAAAYLVVYYNEAAGAGLTAFLAALNAAITAGTANAELINLSDAIS